MTIKFIPSIVSLIICLSSCSHLYYAPNTQNVPLFKEKNEIRAFASIGASTDVFSNYSTSEVQGAYSITNNLAMMSNYMSVSGSDNNDGLTRNRAKGRYLEAALGYYRPIGKYGVFEIYGGFGKGIQHHEYDSVYFQDGYKKGNADLSFNKLFIQPSFGLTYKAFDIGISSRISRLDFYDIISQSDKVNSRQGHELGNISASKSTYLLEPAITIRGGWKYVKLQLQYVYSGEITHNNLNFSYDQISIGIYVAIAKRYNNY